MSRWSQSQPRQNAHSTTRGQGQRGRGSGRGHNAGGNNRGRRMENIASVSRSSGLEKDGDALTIYGDNFRTGNRPPNLAPKDGVSCKRTFLSYSVRRSLQMVLVSVDLTMGYTHLGKLREGLVSSKRYDQFSLEVFQNTKQTTSIIPHLLPDLYEKIPKPHDNLLSTILISLVHELLVAYPSIGNFQQTLDNVMRGSYLQRPSAAYTWITALSSSLKMNNYCKFEALTRRNVFLPLLQDDRSTSNGDLVQKAIFSLIDQLRSRCRDRTWTILRSAYRELACHEESGTRGWLVRSLALQGSSSEDEASESALVDEWLEQKSTLGHVQRKEGVHQRWLVAKVR
ncbi:hypothetical protein V5O48_016936 [Marasmius crinis-equi]|uniref:Uncharacterized protein n=1 Tax=Marasmius crinis-equi TaxID=585013 RepID=A0ABR3EQJ5_9AGAR